MLRHLCRGMTNRKAGEALFISPKTVGRHVENIYARIGVSTRAGAAVCAMEHGLLCMRGWDANPCQSHVKRVFRVG